jgi:predicted ribosome quality control (RQC) complex YloA/Tae2 family protein
MKQEILHPVPAIYHDAAGKRIPSVISLHHPGEHQKAEKYPTVNEMVRSGAIHSLRETAMTDDRDTLIKKIRQSLSRAHRSREQCEIKPSASPEEYERTGNLLLSSLHLIEPGKSTATLPDLYAEGMPDRTVAILPRLSPSANAGKYFEKAKEARVKIQETFERKKKLDEEIAILEEMENALASAASHEEVQLFLKRYSTHLRTRRFVIDQEETDIPPFRIFTVAGEYEVWVGKSSANNDLLTMKYARPNDLWFHVRGASGSHTILRSKGGDTSIPKEAIRQAAAIAAYYSKMRKAGTVPVAYCERKYVKKPKGSASGAVFLEREEITFVKPGLP